MSDDGISKKRLYKNNPKGLMFLERKPIELEDDFLEQFPAFAEFMRGVENQKQNFHIAME